jgi:hypothetical protein
MALPRSRPTLAMLVAEADTKRALAAAVAEHERQVALQEEVAIRRAMGAREQSRTYRAPMREQGMSAPRVIQGNAQVAPLHQQDVQRYRQADTGPRLTPAQQEALDAQHDYQDNWMARDEAGNLHLQRRPLSDMGMEPVPRGVQREMDRLQQSETYEKPAKKAKPMKVRT